MGVAPLKEPGILVTMEIIVREASRDTIQHLKKGGSTFEVNSKLTLSVVNGKISCTVVEVPPCTKQYGIEEFDSNSYIDNPDKVVFLAYLNDGLAGQIRLRKYWNGYAYIDDLAVDTQYRRQGIGRALIERAIKWAKAKGVPGLMLETQDNNVPACKLYESCGFELRGFDTHLYKASDPSSDEIALYWYLVF